MAKVAPFLWSARDGGKLVRYTSGGAPLVFRIADPEPVTPPEFTGDPVISGTGAIGSAVTATDATYTGDEPVEIVRAWYVDGVQVAITDEFTFPSPAGSVVTMQNIAVNAGGTAESALSNEIETEEDVVAPPFHAIFGDALWSVTEDARTPEVQVTFTPEAGFNAVFDPTNFAYHFVCTTSTTPPADPTASTAITSGTVPTPRIGGARAVGTTIYSRIYARRLADGVVELVSNVKSQVLVGSGGEEVEFAAIPLQPNPGLSEGVGKSYSFFNQVGAHIQNAFHARVVVGNAVAAYRGDSAAVAWTIGQIKKWATSDQSGQYEAGYHAQYEMLMSAAAIIALRTPAVLSGLTAAEQAMLPLAIETGLYSGFALMSDANTLSPERNMRGRATSYKSVNPNIGAGSIGLVHLALIHFGVSECMAKLAAFDKVAWRSTLLDNGKMNPAAMTFAVDPQPHHSSYAVPPSNAQMKSWFAGHKRIRGYDMSVAADVQGSILNSWKHCFGANADGSEDTVGSSGEPTVILPGVKFVHGANKDGGVGIPHKNSGTRRGFKTGLTLANYAAKLAAMPFGGERGNVKEMNAIDEGGQRSTVSYSINTMSVWVCEVSALMVVMPSFFDWRAGEVLTVLERARRGCVHLRWASDSTEEPYLNVAKASLTNTSNSETWGPGQQGDKFAFNATFGHVFDVIFKWMRDSDILEPLAGDLAQWEDPVDWSY